MNTVSERSETVAVLGASAKPERYSNQAVRLLAAHGHRVIPVNPGQERIEDLPVARSLDDIATPVDTLSVYLNPAQLEAQIPAILALKPGRVILNPGTESEVVAAALAKAGIAYEEACTLVLLRTGQF